MLQSPCQNEGWVIYPLLLSDTRFLTGPKSLIAINVSNNSMLTIGNGTGKITNEGKVRILAGMSPVGNAIYSPIVATWNSSGIQALGGTWNATTHEFTVSAVQPGESGAAVNIDRLSTQRVLIGDSATQWSLGASFVSTASSAPLSFTATAISDGPLDELNGKLAADERLLGGWNLSADTGYTAGDPIYLSFAMGTVGKNYGRDALQLRWLGLVEILGRRYHERRRLRQLHHHTPRHIRPHGARAGNFFVAGFRDCRSGGENVANRPPCMKGRGRERPGSPGATGVSPVRGAFCFFNAIAHDCLSREYRSIEKHSLSEYHSRLKSQ